MSSNILIHTNKNFNEIKTFTIKQSEISYRKK